METPPNTPCLDLAALGAAYASASDALAQADADRERAEDTYLAVLRAHHAARRAAAESEEAYYAALAESEGNG